MTESAATRHAKVLAHLREATAALGRHHSAAREAFQAHLDAHPVEPLSPPPAAPTEKEATTNESDTTS